MDHLRGRYGEDAVKRAQGMRARHVKQMNPFNGQVDGQIISPKPEAQSPKLVRGA